MITNSHGLKKAVCRLLFLSLVLTCFAADLTAQTRINFKRGKSSATVSGTLAGNGSKQYVVRAKAGQTIFLRITSTNNEATVATRAHSPGTTFEYELEQSGDVNVFLEKGVSK